jgi:uncharacterized protein
MLITTIDLEREPLNFKLDFEPGAIDFAPDATQDGPLHAEGTADLLTEHRGPHEQIHDIRLRASYAGNFQAPCARCVEPVRHEISDEFDLIFRPVGVDGRGSEAAISTSETEIGYYLEGGLLLEDVLREQVILSLPVRSLCQPDCKGLCPRCGENLNEKQCRCDEAPADPRWLALGELGSHIIKE